MSIKDWEKLNISRDEVNRIGEALKKEEFRKMLIDYCQEISDPENRKIYEQEITQLEMERGVNVTFINPKPGYVIKTSSDGTTKVFLNIATNDKIDKPSSVPSTNTDGKRGLNWSLPYTLAQPRRDLDKKNLVCIVYDVVFHPDALHLASRNKLFRDLVNDTAIDAVQQAFKVTLDRANLKFPKISYKGMAKPTVIRKKIEDYDVSQVEPSPLDSIYPPMPDDSKPLITEPTEPPSDAYTIPKYRITQRKSVEFHEMTNELDAKLNVTIPNELEVVIDLPLLNSTQDVELNVTSKRIEMTSEKKGKYRLEVNLPYPVNEENGKAKFDKAKRQLIVTLPVDVERKLKITDFKREDSGVESDYQSVGSFEKFDENQSGSGSPSIDSPVAEKQNTFLDANIDYVLPSFTFNQIDEILAFTLHVKNVDPSSVIIDRKDSLNLAQIKFSSVGAGFFAIHYSFCVKFPSSEEDIFRDISAEAWDNNVIFQFELNNYEFSSYQAGVSQEDLVDYDIAERLSARSPRSSIDHEIADDSLSIEVRSNKEQELIIEVARNESDDESKTRNKTSNDEMSEDVFAESKKGDGTKRQTKKRNKKMRSLSESCCDKLKIINELDSLTLTGNENLSRRKKQTRSLSESTDENGSVDAQSSVQNHYQYKSILKNRTSFSECNESSIDDHSTKTSYSLSATFGISESCDSLSESCKKTVRFSDTIKKQLFR